MSLKHSLQKMAKVSGVFLFGWFLFIFVLWGWVFGGFFVGWLVCLRFFLS